MPNPGLSPERMALQSAYTEEEAIEEVIEAAYLIPMPYGCDHAVEDGDGNALSGCDCDDRLDAYRELRRALALLETYKGVK